MYPANSDRGVQFFQRWMSQHAKYCPKCKRTIRRLSKASAVTKRISRGSLAASLGTLILHAVLFPNHHRFTKLLPWTLFFLISSFSAKILSSKIQSMIERVFVSPARVPSYQLMDIYAAR
ncbi:MAG: hypothetical protein SGARI_007104 [Bacillariaceae sp.]